MDIISQCLSDVMERIAAIPVIQERFAVYTMDQMLHLSKESALPCVGVVLESSVSKDSSKPDASLSADIQFGIYLVTDRDLTSESLYSTIDLLALIRNAIKCQRAPNNHVYRYIADIPSDVGVGIAFVQRWMVSVQFHQDLV